MKNKSAMITGSTSGIGLTIARYPAKEGRHIMLNGFGDRQGIENIQGRSKIRRKLEGYQKKMWFTM